MRALGSRSGRFDRFDFDHERALTHPPEACLSACSAWPVISSDKPLGKLTDLPKEGELAQPDANPMG
eukprot:1160622-Pelagomonas_calceolata.AAC.6